MNLNRMMMKKNVFIILLLFTKTLLLAQNYEEVIDSRPLNSVNINLLGDASLISLNYERQFLINANFILISKIGLGYNEENCFLCSNPDNFITIPHHITGNLGKGRHFFEFGLGGTIISGNTTQPYLIYPIVGYRILPLKSNRINFRIFGQIPFSGIDPDDILFFPFGLNIGISF